MKRILIYSLVIALFLSSCSESILDVNNENSYDGNSFFTNATTAVEASTAMYSPLLYQGMFEREFYFILTFWVMTLSKTPCGAHYSESNILITPIRVR
jgi:hypothetical protein